MQVSGSETTLGALLKMPALDPDSNALEWWKTNANVRYISVTRTSCFTTGAYGSSNSNFSNELTMSINVLSTIYSLSAFSLLATDIYSAGS